MSMGGDIDSELSLELSIGGGKYGISRSNDIKKSRTNYIGIAIKEDLGLSLFTQLLDPPPSVSDYESTSQKGGSSTDTGSHSSPLQGLPNPHDVKAVHMPCVTTTGNGPGGRTVRGFLYNYTSAEVSIVCVCHGSSFSPAGFVEHAGGVGVSHPLRQITVVRSTFG